MTDTPALTTEQARHYLFEIIRESEIVVDCYRRFQAAAEKWLESYHAAKKTGRLLWQGTLAERDMLAAIEGILSGYARISLFFFPERMSGDFGKRRGEMLCTQVGIDGKHPLANRELRNHWMHLDERLDREIRNGRPVPVGYYLGRPHKLSPTAIEETFRLIDPGDEKVYILGKGYHLRELVRAIEHVNQQAVLALLPTETAIEP